MRGIFLLFLLFASTIAPTTLMGQSVYPFVDDGFSVPEVLQTSEFRLRMLTIHDVDKDYAAVMSSVEHLRNVWPESGWPDGLTIEDNLIDLGWHHREFTNRTSFAYTMVALDESEVIGCVYINPTRKRGYDSEVYLWVRESELKNGLDDRLFDAVTKWLDEHWEFKNPGFPGRTIAWEEWNAIPDEKR
jgi:RimJ/RimL family protein N-acetyltransferase